jgi:murein DD-endopeptidase MepM/ murein hydrolase activator NlpD
MNLSRYFFAFPALLCLVLPTGVGQALVHTSHPTLAIQNSLEIGQIPFRTASAALLPKQSVGSTPASAQSNFQAVPANPPSSQTDSQANPQTDTLCPEPALSRVTRHQIAPGETLTSLSQRYDLIPATLMGMNPVLRDGAAPVGAEILIPPYNGIRVEVPAGSTWRELAEVYGARADVLFEVNGCQANPTVVFVPGVNWSPNQAGTGAPATIEGVLRGYPLPAIAFISTGYGWQLDSESGTVAFHSGVDLVADPGTPVLSVGEGTIAFASNQGNYGNLIVINHGQGLQTRYAQLGSIEVEVGQTVRPGDRIGTVGATGLASSPHLHFEVRSNSDLGWVAQDPGAYFQDMRIAEQ